MTEGLRDSSRPYLAFGVLSLAAVGGGTILLTLSQRALFQPYFGPINPVLVIVGVAALGVASLGSLRTRWGFVIFEKKASVQGIAVSATWATLFAMMVIAADLSVGFPEDINAPWPYALLFYPTIAYVVEIVFHTGPLTLVLMILKSRLQTMKAERRMWLGLFFTSLPEPIFQVTFGGNPFSWSGAFLGMHLFAFNLLQLHIFRRCDFVSMYGFRFVYYVHWHIVWGHVRLHFLF